MEYVKDLIENLETVDINNFFEHMNECYTNDAIKIFILYDLYKTKLHEEIYNQSKCLTMDKSSKLHMIDYKLKVNRRLLGDIKIKTNVNKKQLIMIDKQIFNIYNELMKTKYEILFDDTVFTKLNVLHKELSRTKNKYYSLNYTIKKNIQLIKYLRFHINNLENDFKKNNLSMLRQKKLDVIFNEFSLF